MAIFNIGARRWDAVAYNESTCMFFDGINALGRKPAGVTANVTVKNSERYFASGNERTPVTFHPRGAPVTAYHLDADDKFVFIIELMNMNMVDSEVYLTVTYDIIDGPLPQGWKEVKPVYLDANQCVSEVESPKGQSKFSIQSKPWK